MDSRNAFIEQLAQVPVMAAIKEEAIAKWGDDILPAVLYSRMGTGLASRFKDLSPAQQTEIFGAIESNLVSGDQILKDAIGTCLLEALYKKAVAEQCWDEVQLKLGRSTAAYLEAWLES